MTHRRNSLALALVAVAMAPFLTAQQASAAGDPAASDLPGPVAQSAPAASATALVDGDPTAVAADPSGTRLVPLVSGSPATETDFTTAAKGTLAAASASACRAGIDYPHVSGTYGVTYTINTHLDGNCRSVPTVHTIEGSLSRSRWYGWEHLTSGSASKPGARKLSLYLNKKCTPGDWYRYRADGRFYALVGGTRWSVSSYNQNPDEIKCVRTAGASS